ncbi:hypothetical protein BDZ45DRAFT_675208 [Acephala macrosclerotiorum]|nr:hypothetical protein BDZ45DRAFT_675208 [Acephala macrosclerotiorum]
MLECIASAETGHVPPQPVLRLDIWGGILGSVLVLGLSVIMTCLRLFDIVRHFRQPL